MRLLGFSGSGKNLTMHLTTIPQIDIGRGWNLSVIPYEQSQSIDVVDNCFAIMFTNIGDTVARMNGMVIFPSATPTTSLGDSRTVSGHWLDIFKGNLRLAFDVPGGATPLVEVVQFFYTSTVKTV
jgi:hypothetical protein